MAVLSDQERFEVWADFMKTNVIVSGALTKVDLRAVVNAIDQFMSDNAAAANAAIPLPGRTALTTVQKALLLTQIVHKRYLSGV